MEHLESARAMTAQPNPTLKESPMNTTLIALFALSFSTDALADRGGARTTADRSSSSRSIASVDSMGLGGGDRAIAWNYWLTLESYPSDPADPELIQATFSGIWGENVSNMRFCWKEADVPGDACWSNNVKLTNGDGDWVGPSYNVSYQVGSSWHSGHTYYHQWTMDIDWMDEEDVDPIYCGVEYTFKLRNNPWHDDLTTTIPCPAIADDEVEDEVEDVEECTECPDGGVYDGAHCYLGDAPAGSFATIQGDNFVAHNVLGQQVEVVAIADGAEAFVWNNAYYYHPECAPVEEVCEECPFGGWYDGAHCYVGSAPANSEAFLTDTQYAYSPEEFADCGFGDTVLRSGDCAAQDIPEDADAFVWSNNWYYHPVCE